ncbi:xylulokinase [Virgibacillus natechei]|uniref:Xylulose kinase n=1 Tax=Virgibacillus natechei TaxID=1216297 RepID=A0ABS4IFA4_9BACI|nr:xylulokinase [Virgibacillus natechei]MBP1969305.1 xylulokinase [Virgibacillus natechei]UZD12458.1 xylulokinase [Virgibacillus natechei]
MKYVMGVDLGTSAVKILLVDQHGEVAHVVSKPLSLMQEKTGFSEQDPKDWVDQTVAGMSDLLKRFNGDPADIEGISFSGQMHGLVLLDDRNEVLRNAILWNDTRTTAQCQEIYDVIGEERLLEITKNPALEGFTLPKLLWVREHEPEVYAKADKFVLPKDYLRYKLTGELQMEYSDAAGTLLLNVTEKKWSEELCDSLDIDVAICPPLVESSAEVGKPTPEIAEATGLANTTRVFAGGADNACGAIGSGILEDGKTLVSTGTSGVVLSYESSNEKDFQGKVHYFNHGAPDAFYTMGVTLAAGYSLSWFKDVFAGDESFEDFVAAVDTVPIGSNGLLFTPYVAGERTPHADASIRASFIGMDGSHKRPDFVRAVMEGITFSLNESIDIFRKNGKTIDTIVSTGGGAKNEDWLQMQADIFDANVVKQTSEQGPGMGAAMLAAYGCGWFDSLQDCADEFLQEDNVFTPNRDSVDLYKKLFTLYQKVYGQTKELNEKLLEYRK